MKSLKKLPYYHLIVKRDLQSAAAIHYTTKSEADQCHQALGLKNKAYVIPNGIDLSEFSNLPDKFRLKERYPYLKEKKLILFLGRIHRIKGLDILVQSFAKLAKDRDDVHLVIVGKDEEGYGEKVKNLINEHGLNYGDYRAGDKEGKLNPEVSFTGMLKGNEKLEALSGCHICVQPSYSENFGMSAVEAMACRIPVVISNKVGIYEEVQKMNAGIVVDADAQSLYEGIKLLFENYELREKIAINGRKMAEEYYNIDKVAESMIEMFHELIYKKCSGISL
jgi:glycosyltransferase involved in cell wall biosynthesis